MSAKQLAPWHWSQITHVEVVARLFPSAAKHGASLDEMIPGRYWPAWKKPADATTLDDTVKKELVDGNILLPRQQLAQSGFLCPYFAWRECTATAARHATKTHWAFSPERRKALETERDTWRERLRTTRSLLTSRPVDALPIGSLYINSNDLGDDLREKDFARLYSDRTSRLGDLANEARRDEQMIALLSAELDRLDRLGEGKSGANAPDRWRTPFFVLMANLWVALTGRPVPDAGGPLRRILQDATAVISGDHDSIRDWGQARSLLKRFENAPAGEGFRKGEHDFLCSETVEGVASRGRAMADLIEIASGEQQCHSFVRALAQAAIHLRDHAEGNLALIMRDLVLRREMTQEVILPPRLELQLGWIKSPKRDKVKSALEGAVDAARRGDLAAVAVVQIAHVYEDARAIIETRGWPEPFAGFGENDFIADLMGRDRRMPEWHMLDGDFKAFMAAWLMIGTRARPEQPVGKT